MRVSAYVVLRRVFEQSIVYTYRVDKGLAALRGLGGGAARAHDDVHEDAGLRDGEAADVRAHLGARGPLPTRGAWPTLSPVGGGAAGHRLSQP